MSDINWSTPHARATVQQLGRQPRPRAVRRFPPENASVTVHERHRLPHEVGGMVHVGSGFVAAKLCCRHRSPLSTPRPLRVLMVPSSQALSAAPVCKRQSAHGSAPVIMIGRLYLVVIWSMYLRHGSAECHPGAECRSPSSRWLQAAGGSASMAGARRHTVGKRRRCRASSSAPPAPRAQLSVHAPAAERPPALAAG